MPSCSDCKWIRQDKTCGVGASSPLRNCVVAIVNEYGQLLKPGSRVLEVGCGAWSPLRDAAERIGGTWEGIDVNSRYRGRPTIATRIGSVAKIPFADREFDYVVATQSLEHWEEHRVDPLQGLSEVFRVLRPCGWALFNVPIHFHGAPRFVFGRLHEIRSLFEPFASEIRMEAWRDPPDPLQPCRLYLSHYWHKPELWGRSSYVLDIRARRADEVPYLGRPPIPFWEKLASGIRQRGLLYYLSLSVTRVAASARKRIGR